MAQKRWVAGLLCGGLMLMAPAASAAEQAGTTITLQKRVPLKVFYTAPLSEIARVRQADVLQVLDEVLEKNTDLRVDTVEGADDCGGEMHCIVLKARTDYDYGRDKRRPYPEHLARLKEEGIEHAQFLLVLSNFSEEGKPDRISGVLVDTDAALQIYHDAPRDPGVDWRPAVEAKVGTDAVVVRTKEQEISGLEELEPYFDSLVEIDFHPFFEKAGNWDPYGRIELRVDIGGLEVKVDGAIVGTTKSGITIIDRVPAGERTITLEGPTVEAYSTAVVVDRGAVATVEPDLTVSGTGGAVHDAVFWGGVAIASVGAVFTGWAIAQQVSSRPEVYCFYTADVEPDCGSSRWLTESIDQNAGSGQDPNSGSIPLAPLGYSLLGMGGIWTLGTELFTDPGEDPWVPVGVGLGVGVAAFALSVVLNGTSAHDATAAAAEMGSALRFNP